MKKRDRLVWIRCYPLAKRRNERDIVQVASKEYRHMAGVKRDALWNEGLKIRHPEYEKTRRCSRPRATQSI